MSFEHRRVVENITKPEDNEGLFWRADVLANEEEQSSGLSLSLAGVDFVQRSIMGQKGYVKYMMLAHLTEGESFAPITMLTGLKVMRRLPLVQCLQVSVPDKISNEVTLEDDELLMWPYVSKMSLAVVSVKGLGRLMDGTNQPEEPLSINVQESFRSIYHNSRAFAVAVDSWLR